MKKIDWSHFSMICLTVLCLTIFWLIVVLVVHILHPLTPVSDTNSLTEPSGAFSDTSAGLSVFEFVVTAYCKCEKCCGIFSDGITASGELAEGFLVAAPPEIPFGTLIVIDGYANGLPVEVLDRGGAIKGNKLDILFDTHKQALNWGRKRMNVKILEK